jgi:hypothetical protein
LSDKLRILLGQLLFGEFPLFLPTLSFDSRSLWAERRFSRSEEVVARDEEAPVQNKQVISKKCESEDSNNSGVVGDIP